MLIQFIKNLKVWKVLRLPLDNKTTPATESKLQWLALQRYSKEAYQAYTIIADNTKSDMDLMSIKYYLLCRSLELALKSILLQRKKCNSEDLKYKYRHNLVKLVKSAEKLPIVTINDQELTIIKVLNSYYNDKQFEYPKTGFKTFPVLEDVRILVKRFIWE